MARLVAERTAATFTHVPDHSSSTRLLESSVGGDENWSRKVHVAGTGGRAVARYRGNRESTQV